VSRGRSASSPEVARYICAKSLGLLSREAVACPTIFTRGLPVAKAATKKRKSARAPKSRKGQTAKRNTSGLIPFAKGNPGKPKGAKNKFGVRLKEAILEAAERSGRDGKGKDGAVGYLVWLSRAEPAVFGRMLEKVMPLQIDVKDKTDKLTPAEAIERLRDRGLPIPESLNTLARQIGHAVSERQDEDYDAELNGEEEKPEDQEDAA
jgi:hypothetical protein